MYRTCLIKRSEWLSNQDDSQYVHRNFSASWSGSEWMLFTAGYPWNLPEFGMSCHQPVGCIVAPLHRSTSNLWHFPTDPQPGQFALASPCSPDCAKLTSPPLPVAPEVPRGEAIAKQDQWLATAIWTMWNFMGYIIISMICAWYSHWLSCHRKFRRIRSKPFCSVVGQFGRR